MDQSWYSPTRARYSHQGREARLAPVRQQVFDSASKERTTQGELVTETMLVEGVNDNDDQLREVAEFLTRLEPATSYLSVPTRPPAEQWARPPYEEVINRAYQILGKSMDQVEYLTGYEGNAFAFTGDAEEDLLSITAVHPMREEAVSEFLKRAKVDWAAVHRLIEQDQLVQAEHEGVGFYVRRLH